MSVKELVGKPCPKCGRPMESVYEAKRGASCVYLYAYHFVGKPISCYLGRKEKVLAALAARSQAPFTEAAPSREEAPSKPPEPQAPPTPFFLEGWWATEKAIVVPWRELRRVVIRTPAGAFPFLRLFLLAKKVRASRHGLLFRLR